MNELILVRYGDIVLKGKNQKYFVKTANDRIQEVFSSLPVTFDFRHDRLYLILNGVVYHEAIMRLVTIPGLHSFSLVSKCAVDYSEAADLAVAMIENKITSEPITFKVETKRADKTIQETSTQISQLLAKSILKRLKQLKVDVHHPQLTLNVEMRKDGCYMYLDQIKGMGGFPVPMGGRAIALLSGGIDSPVAAYIAIKKGIEVECVHFESTPMTPLESVQKTLDLCAVLARYLPHDQIRLHLVPFQALHERLIRDVPESYLITIMRRMMLRIASIIQEEASAKAIITGDSIGQVASQTLESLETIQDATDRLLIRPLAGMDKSEIIKIADHIDTLEISNRAFSDCCSIYVPKNPAIRPQIAIAKKYESQIDFAPLVEECAKARRILTIHAGEKFELNLMGLSVQEALK
ncbi:MAG: tRNA 4-thiouridine(8) synthase ThiI [Candidatus Izemoplasmatales bacterium]|nr:tRNA 4-thiouridine(8) synthase ThiI [Candidatus Izemoplasmatales bacterium]